MWSPLIPGGGTLLLPGEEKCLSSPSENSMEIVRRPDVTMEKQRATVCHDDKWGCQESWRPWDPQPIAIVNDGAFPRTSEARAPSLQ